ncbi:MAG: AAA family ATPase [Candidatus Aenigmatarchaeota archaeon]
MQFVEDLFTFLDESYIPERLPFRDNQIIVIKEKIEKYAKNLRPTNLLIFGGSGLGKTACVKYVFKNFQPHRIKYVYINSFIHNSLNSLLIKIAEELKIGITFKGLSNEEILEKIMTHSKNNNIKLVICIDEIDKLKDLNEFLYTFSRSTSFFDYSPYLILISNSKDFILQLDKRVLSSFVFDDLEFKPYTFEQLKIIAEERIKPIFKNNYDKAAITLIANLAYNNGSDVRVILRIIRKALEIIIDENKDKLSLEIVKKVVKNFESKIEKINEVKIDERQKEILEILKSGEKYTSEIFEEISKKFGIKKRTFNYLMEDLAKKGLIEIKRVKGIKGSKFIAKLKL